MSLETHKHPSVVACAVYVDGKRCTEPVHVDDANDVATDAGGFVWLGLHEPNAEDFADIALKYGLHPLAVEDAVPLDGLRQRLEGQPELLAHGPSAVLWAVADLIVDEYVVVADAVEGDVDVVEAQVFSPDKAVHSALSGVPAQRLAVTDSPPGRSHG